MYLGMFLLRTLSNRYFQVFCQILTPLLDLATPISMWHEHFGEQLAFTNTLATSPYFHFA